MPHPTTHVHTSPPVESLHVEGFGLSSLTAAGAEPSTSTPCNSTVVHQTQPGQASEDFLPASHVLDIRHSSCSRENFASNTVKELFSKDERLRCNVKGVFGKSKFDIRKMEYVRRQTFKFFPISSTENEKKCWANCVKAIDSSSRQLNRTIRRTTVLQEKENTSVTTS